MKEKIKSLIKKLPIAFTKNQRYDLYTEKILKKHLSAKSNCLDIGCFKGEVLDMMIEMAPQGTHQGFEPIPVQYDFLKNKYQNKRNIHIHNVALSDKAGEATFNYVKSNPAYSGLKKRAYDRPHEEDEEITVSTQKLDTIISKELKIDLIKIDVEGAEFQVLSGAKQTLENNRPIVIFEHGKGASEFYGTTPEMIYALFDGLNMSIGLLDGFYKGNSSLSSKAFSKQYEERLNHYFVAYPKA